MYGDMIYVEDGQRGRPVAQLPHDKMAGRNEAWLRDMLFDHPELLPITAIDPSFGPLIPLCKEMKIGSGRADLVYINRDGLLTIVECKLWNNPEARRKVVGQILDYGSTVFEWSYSDLEREVRHATQIRRSEHVVYDQVAAHHATLEQAHFVDAVSAALKRGRFLLLVAGNGIRSEVTKIHALFERNLGSGFAFGLVEVGLYPLSDNSLIVQPRVLAKTTLLERPRTENVTPEQLDTGAPSEEVPAEAGSEANSLQREYQQWWQPVTTMRFDDPNQEPPRLYWRNHVRTRLPWPRTWLTAYRFGSQIAVSTSGNHGALADLELALIGQFEETLAELPVGSVYRPGEPDLSFGIHIKRLVDDTETSETPQQWAIRMLNEFSNVLRPRVEAAWQTHHDR